jgi:hypothetical protein
MDRSRPLKHLSLEDVRAIRNGNPSTTIEHGMAVYELQLRDEEAKAIQAERLRQAATEEEERKHRLQIAAGEAANRKIVDAIQKLEKPHWTLTPTFWISLGILVVSVIILIVAVLAWRFPKNEQPIPNGKPSLSSSNSVARPTNLPSAKPATQ